MPSDVSTIPFRFELKWLAGPFLIILAAALLILFFPAPMEPPLSTSGLPEQPKIFSAAVNVNEAKALAQTQCAHTYSCRGMDCLEKVLTHVDSASESIHAVLRTPAPRVLRDHLRAAIKRGVDVQLVLDSSLNPKFYLEGASIRVKRVSQFVATNFMIIDDSTVVFGSDPLVYAMDPDVIQVVCQDPERRPYFALFDRVWGEESSAFTPETTQEEILSDAEILIPETSSSCQESACGPDTFTCEGTTKIYRDYFCADACMYQIIPLYYSLDCGYTHPGFGPDGSPLIIITESDVDGGTLASEFIEFTALQPLELTGFTLLRNDESLITFSAPFILNGAARVYSGGGTTVTTIVYLNQDLRLWNEPGTTATLQNPQGEVVATQTFEG